MTLGKPFSLFRDTICHLYNEDNRLLYLMAKCAVLRSVQPSKYIHK